MRQIVQTLIVLAVSLSGYAWAANYSDPVDGTYKGAYGNTISVEIPSQVSKSPDSNLNENGDLTFTVNSNTAYKNFNQLPDLKYGDAVRVDYTDDPKAKDKVLIATGITRLGAEVTANVPVTNDTTTTVTTIPAAQQAVTTTTTTTP